MKRSIIILTTFLSIGLTDISYAGYLDDWTDDQLCGWMDNPSPPEHIVAEINKRGLSCGVSNNASSSSTTTTNTSNTDTSVIGELAMDFELTSYDVEFSEKVTEELLSETLKTDFDFSEFKIANNHISLECQFYLEEVMHDQTGPWTIADGYLKIDSGKVKIDVDKLFINGGSKWKRGGLSTDPKYLRDEVNLRLTEDGYLVGKLAFFEWVGDGEPPKLPIYPRLLKHKKSIPLSYKKPITGSAKFWLEKTLDWSDGVLYLNNCIMYEESYKDGKLDGKRTTWYQSGEIKSEVHYLLSKRQGEDTTWYENGQKKAQNHYINGKKEGKSTTWYKNGQKKSEVNYKDNTKDGKKTEWYGNGQKKSEGNYKPGNAGFTVFYPVHKEGKFTTWHENGQIKSEVNYKDGKFIVTE